MEPRTHANTASAEPVLVTGAAGFIGSHVAERLVARGCRVIGIDNFDPFYSPAEKRGNIASLDGNPAFRLIEADCARLEEMERMLVDEAIEVVVHLAAKAGVRPSIADPLAYVDANVVATMAMLEFARRRGIRRFVFGSSSSVYGNTPEVPFSEDRRVDRPISPYAASKAAGELLCHTYHHLHGLSIDALRFFTVYGPRQRPDLAIRKFATLMLRDEPIPVFGDGSMARDYTWIEDIVRGVIAAVDRTRSASAEFEIINLGGSRPTTLDSLIRLLADAIGREPRIDRKPAPPGDVERTFADVAKAERLLGYRPMVSIEEGIPRFVDWLRSSGLA